MIWFKRRAALRRVREAAAAELQAEEALRRAMELPSSGGSTVDPELAIRRASQGIRAAAGEAIDARTDAGALAPRWPWGRFRRWLQRVNQTAREGRTQAEQELRTPR